MGSREFVGSTARTAIGMKIKVMIATFPTNRKSYVLISMLTRFGQAPFVIAPAKVKELRGRVRRAETPVTYQKGKGEYRKGRLRTVD
jgi:hypothetical protein